MGKIDEAYDAFNKAAWKDCSYLSLAQINMARTDYILALEHVNQALNNNKNSSKAYVIKTAAHRKLKQTGTTLQIANYGLSLDRFNLGLLFESGDNVR